MSDIAVKTNASQVVIRLDQFRLGITERTELMRTIGAGQLVSIRRTFADEGSPAGSWAPLSEATKRWGGKQYTPGHKLLILSGLMLNSIEAVPSDSNVTIGTNMPRARVHQLGFSGTQKVSPYGYTLRRPKRNRYDRSKIGKRGPVSRKVSSGVTFVQVKAFTRRLNIPARPFLVFRPEDPARIGAQVREFIKLKGVNAGLKVV